MSNKIALRSYIKSNHEKRNTPIKNNPPSYERLLILDTETTIDEFQNLKFGSFMIISNGKIILKGIFFSEDLNKKKKKIIEEYCKINNLGLFSKKEFVEEVFYPEMLELRTLCIGFNLPFDLSRLAIHFGEGRYAHRGWFSLQLSENKSLPRLKIKHVDSIISFINFSKNKNNFKGYFLDLKTLASTFSDDKHITLKGAGIFFKCNKIKQDTEEHGKISFPYLDYNLNDVESTYGLFLKLLEHYKIYDIEIPLTNIYSSASISKNALEQLGIKPLSKINSCIDSNLKGGLMTAYFGGRCEVKMRKTPVKTSVLDFLSMYPSLTINMGLWDFIIAKEIREETVTEEIIRFLKTLKLNDLTNKEIWKGFNVLIELQPDEDILPVRSDYLNKSGVLNIGINYLKSKDTLHYALPDVISSVLLTGKVPRIKKAIRFIPIEQQDSLRPSKIFGFDINPKEENLIKKLIEKRAEIKEKRDSYPKTDQDYLYYDGMQKALKILANSITYGIFIELKQKEKESDVTVYNNTSFETRQRAEKEGKFFNPLVAVMQISGARLLLAMAESYVASKGDTHYYMDTDSCYVSPKIARELQEFFSPLNPYEFKSDFFKIEKEDLWFYAISAKRYVLYELVKGKPIIQDFKLHGLGHLLNPYKSGINWQKQIWQDILDLEYGIITEQEIIEKYSNLYALSKLTISTPSIYKRFKKYNQDKLFSQQIKPFNFILVGQGTDKNIKPITSFSKSQEVVHNSFIDYNSSKVMKGVEHWKSMKDIIFEYLSHPESKFENGKEKGLMKRRFIFDGKIVYIGKEVNNLENQFLEIKKPTEYVSEKEKINSILNMNTKTAREKGIPKQTLFNMKKRLRTNPEKFNWNTKQVRRLIG